MPWLLPVEELADGLGMCGEAQFGRFPDEDAFTGFRVGTERWKVSDVDRRGDREQQNAQVVAGARVGERLEWDEHGA